MRRDTNIVQTQGRQLRSKIHMQPPKKHVKQQGFLVLLLLLLPVFFKESKARGQAKDREAKANMSKFRFRASCPEKLLEEKKILALRVQTVLWAKNELRNSQNLQQLVSPVVLSASEKTPASS